jgi:hypothetical protein
MPTLSRAQIEAVVRAGGLPTHSGSPSGTPATWAAVAMLESSGRTDVVNRLGCVGLWQICPVNFGWLGVTQGELKDPAANWRAAKRVFARQGWRAWSVVDLDPGGDNRPSAAWIAENLGRNVSLTDPGAWAAGAQVALDQAADAVPDNPIAQLVMPLGIIAGAFKGITEWVTDPNTWKRVALVIAGGGIVLVGVAAIAGPKLDEITPAPVKRAVTKGLVK